TLRGAPDRRPKMSVVVPVNAQGDLENVVDLLGDLVAYGGPHTAEIIPVVNNFPDGEPPPEVETFLQAGLVTLAIPSVRRHGEAVGFSARMPGIRAASADFAVLFDADCRVPHPTRLLNWYVEQFANGAQAAYTP